MKVQFREQQCELAFESYYDGNLAIRLIDEQNGEPVATATVNMPEHEIPHGFIAVKDYSENAGMVQALVEAGVIHPQAAMRIPSGFVEIPVHQLTAAALEAAGIEARLGASPAGGKPGDPEADAEFPGIYMKLHEWTKRLGQQHFSLPGASTTLCDMPMLGNNYAQVLQEQDKRPCTSCINELLHGKKVQVNKDKKPPTIKAHLYSPGEREAGIVSTHLTIDTGFAEGDFDVSRQDLRNALWRCYCDLLDMPCDVRFDDECGDCYEVQGHKSYCPSNEENM